MPFLTVNDVRIHYHVQGKGAALVFLHPPCIGSRVFTYLSNDLARDHRTLMFDFRGHGRSAASDVPLTVPLLARDTVRLMEQLDLSSAYICAYSVASMVALEAMHTYPDRIRGAILLGGMAEPSARNTRRKLRLAAWAGRLGAKDLLSVPILWSNSDNPYTLKRLRAETVAGHLANWRQYFEATRAYSAVDRLPEIRQPVLLLCGEKDGEGRQHALTLQRGLANLSTAFIPCVKHTLPTDAAGEAGPLCRGWLYAQEGRDPEENGSLEEVLPHSLETYGFENEWREPTQPS